MTGLTLQAKGEPATRPAPASLIARAGGWFGIMAALLLYLVTRIGQLAAIDWMTPAGGPSVRDHLLVWDASWFVRVATEGYAHGYSYDEHGQMVGNGLAFFPLYPLLIRAGAATGMSAETAALVVAWLAAAAAAVLLHLLGTSLYSRRVGFALVVLACAQPMSVVLSMGYSEGLFLALVAGMLLAAHQRYWPVAGALGLAAALTRPTGAAAAVALTVAALGTLRASEGARSGASAGGVERSGASAGGVERSGASRAERWQALTAAGVALAGVPAYLLWVALRVGDWNAWFTIQTAGWGSSFDYGSSVVRFAVDSLRGGTDWVPLSTVWILAAAVVAAAVAIAQRVWAPLTVYGLLALILVLGQAGYYHSKPRLLVPVLLILVPAAVVLGRARPRTAVLVLAGYAAFGLWYGAHMVAVWPYTI